MVRLAAGDMILGDVRIVQAKNLFVIQRSLTGESFPVEKVEVEVEVDATAAASVPLELRGIAFLDTSVESGSATAVLVAIGPATYLGGMAWAIAEPPAPTAFDKDLRLCADGFRVLAIATKVRGATGRQRGRGKAVRQGR